MPTSPTVAFRIGERVDDPWAMYASDVLTVPVNLAGLPGISLPCGLSDGPAGGLPAGRRGVRREPDPGRLPMRWSRRWASTRGRPPRRRRGHERRRALRAGDRPRDPRAAEHRLEDVLPVREPLRRRAQHADLPGLPRASGRAPDDQRRGGREGDPDRARARLRHRRPVPVSPQELLLSRQPEGVPDQPVRPADLRARPPRRRRRADRDHPGAPRGGRRQARARRRRRRAHRRGGVVGRRLQPVRHAARRDRDRARYPLARAGAGVPRAAQEHAPDDRGLGLRHGEGVAALRRQRLGASARRDRRSGRRPSSRT